MVRFFALLALATAAVLHVVDAEDYKSYRVRSRWRSTPDFTTTAIDVSTAVVQILRYSEKSNSNRQRGRLTNEATRRKYRWPINIVIKEGFFLHKVKILVAAHHESSS